MPGRSRFLLVVAAAALAAPATASATTYTVDRAASPGCNGNVCRSIADANAAVGDGDTISIKASKVPYVESPLVVTRNNVTFEGQPGGAIITSNATADGAVTIRIGDGTVAKGEGTTFKGLFVSGQKNGGAAIQISAKGATLDSMFVARATENTEDASVVLIDPAIVGTTTIKSTYIVNTPVLPAGTTDAQSAPALQGGEASSLVLQDSFVLSGVLQGGAVVLSGNDRTADDDTMPVANKILRSSLYASQTDADALTVLSGSGSSVNKLVSVDSTILSGGQNGGGLRATSEAGLLVCAPIDNGSVAGDVKVTMVHTTIAGGTEAIVALAEAEGDGVSKGSIDISADRSIVKGTVTGANTEDGADLCAQATGNTVKIEVKNSDTNVSGSTVNEGRTLIVAGPGNQDSATTALFADSAKRDYHLRLGSPAIDKGGPQGAGESDKDVDSEPRVNGAATDIGADEFFNKPPVPSILTAKDTFAIGEVVNFDGSKSTDPEALAGGGIAKYVWNFGDGSGNFETALPTASHAYTAAGTYKARLAVVDTQGAVSTIIAVKTITISGAAADATPPVVTITAPKVAQILKLYRLKTKLIKRAGKKPLRRVTRTSRTIRFKGRASDASGIGGVQIALRRVSLAGAAQSGKCTFFDFAANTFKVLQCAKPRFSYVALTGNAWAYKIKKATIPKLRAGTYELIVRATDKTGTTSVPVRRTFGFKIS